MWCKTTDHLSFFVLQLTMCLRSIDHLSLSVIQMTMGLRSTYSLSPFVLQVTMCWRSMAVRSVTWTCCDLCCTVVTANWPWPSSPERTKMPPGWTAWTDGRTEAACAKPGTSSLRSVRSWNSFIVSVKLEFFPVVSMDRLYTFDGTVSGELFCSVMTSSPNQYLRSDVGLVRLYPYYT